MSLAAVSINNTPASLKIPLHAGTTSKKMDKNE